MLTRKRIGEILGKLEGISFAEWEELKKLIDNEFCVTANKICFSDCHRADIIVKLDKENPIKLQIE